MSEFSAGEVVRLAYPRDKPKEQRSLVRLTSKHVDGYTGKRSWNWVAVAPKIDYNVGAVGWDYEDSFEKEETVKMKTRTEKVWTTNPLIWDTVIDTRTQFGIKEWHVEREVPVPVSEEFVVPKGWRKVGPHMPDGTSRKMIWVTNDASGGGIYYVREDED